MLGRTHTMPDADMNRHIIIPPQRPRENASDVKLVQLVVSVGSNVIAGVSNRYPVIQYDLSCTCARACCSAAM